MSRISRIAAQIALEDIQLSPEEHKILQEMGSPVQGEDSEETQLQRKTEPTEYPARNEKYREGWGNPGEIQIDNQSYDPHNVLDADMLKQMGVQASKKKAAWSPSVYVSKPRRRKSIVNTLPSGADFRAVEDGGPGDAHWSVRGGYRGEKSLRSTAEKLLKRGFTEGGYGGSETPDGSNVGGTRTFSDGEGNLVTLSHNYGSTAASNWYSASTKFATKVAEESREASAKDTFEVEIPLEEVEETLSELEVTPIIKREEPTVLVIEICPHCQEEIREKSMYMDPEGYEWHRPCDQGPIGKIDLENIGSWPPFGEDKDEV